MRHFYKASTHKIDVSVNPQYIKNNNIFYNRDKFLWKYAINIKNNSSTTIQILRRHWRILHQDGTFQEINGEGVIGKQPILVPQLEFNYDSHVELDYESAVMSGYYDAKTQDGRIFRIKIPSFSLDIPGVNLMVN